MCTLLHFNNMICLWNLNNILLRWLLPSSAPTLLEFEFGENLKMAVKEAIISNGFSIVLTRIREDRHQSPVISPQYMWETENQIAFEIICLVGEEDTPDLFQWSLKWAGGSESIEAIYLLDLKHVGIMLTSLEEIQLCFYIQKSNVVCIMFLSCAGWLQSGHAVMPKCLWFCFCQFNWNNREVGGAEEL